ncbi:MAG: hypothetical protein FD134_2216, partial [Gallionellaceae bacterium]
MSAALVPNNACPQRWRGEVAQWFEFLPPEFHNHLADGIEAACGEGDDETEICRKMLDVLREIHNDLPESALERRCAGDFLACGDNYLAPEKNDYAGAPLVRGESTEAMIERLIRQAKRRDAAARMLADDPQPPNPPDSAGRIAYRRASDVKAKPINWLWPGRIARGKVSMLAGNPGLGKSQITASMAATVTTGGMWPVDRARCQRGNVVFLSAEDDAEDTIRPRLEAAGADLSRVFILDAVVDGYRADGSEALRGFNLKTDLHRLGKMLDEIGGAALIVIDPITAYLGEADSHKNAEIRALLAPLSDLAAKHGAAVVCVSHLNKSAGGEALMRVTGSLAFVAAARAAFIVTKDPEDDARRLFLPLKNNIGNDQTGLAFAIQAAQVKSATGLIETSRIAWEPEAVTVTADEAVSTASNPEEHSDMQDAKIFLRDLLSG